MWGTTSVPARFRCSFRYFNPRSPCGERPLLYSGGTFAGLYFNPRSPCGERPGCRDIPPLRTGISIHVPRVGNDPCPCRAIKNTRQNFNPRSPCGERRRYSLHPSGPVFISIHVPRVGNDPERKIRWCRSYIFQSTFPVWGTTLTHPDLTGSAV